MWYRHSHFFFEVQTDSIDPLTVYPPKRNKKWCIIEDLTILEATGQQVNLLGKPPCTLLSSWHNWLTNSSHSTSCESHCYPTEKQGCCWHLTHQDSSPDIHSSKGSMSSRLLWQGPGCVAKIATESFTDVFCTLTQTMNSPGRPKKIKEMVKTWWKAFLFKIISSIEKVTIAFININMEFPYSDHFPIWNGERVTHRV